MRLRPGQLAPIFSVVDLYGRRISLLDYANVRVLISFFRAAVCPLCTYVSRNSFSAIPSISSKVSTPLPSSIRVQNTDIITWTASRGPPPHCRAGERYL